MSENLQMAVFFLSCITFLVFIIILYFFHKNKLIAKCLEKGIDPAAVRRAFRDTSAHDNLLYWQNKELVEPTPPDPK